MEVFLKRLQAYAGDNWPDAATRIVTGRPVHFAGANPDSSLAMRRYSEALGRLGFPELHYVYEPVAAAFYFARNLRHDATVLVADFGGGTSDFFADPVRDRGWAHARHAARPVRRGHRRRPVSTPASSNTWSRPKSERAVSS